MPKINQRKVTAKWYKKIMNNLSQRNYQIEIAETNKKYYLEDAEINIISERYQGTNINNCSTVLKITYG